MAEGYIRHRGDSYYYSFEAAGIGGKRKRIERFGGHTEKEAKRALRNAIAEYERAGIEYELSNLSVADFFDYWFKKYVERNLKYNTQHNYKNIIAKYIKPRLGNYKLRSLSPAVLQKFIDDVSEIVDDRTHRTLAKHTVEIIFTVLKGAFRKAVYPYQFIRDNPMNYVDMPKYNIKPHKSREDLKIITLQQYDQILQFIPPADSFHIPLLIGFNTGMRRGEVCGLQWDMVDLDAATIKVERNMIQLTGYDYELASPKTAASYRTILIGSSLLNELRTWHKQQMENRLRYGSYYFESNFVCTHENGKPVTPNSIKYKCGHISKELGFPFNYHSLRHTHATLLLENGAKPKEIQERLGHSRIATTLDTYSHVTQKMKQNTVDILERIQKNS